MTTDSTPTPALTEDRVIELALKYNNLNRAGAFRFGRDGLLMFVADLLTEQRATPAAAAEIAQPATPSSHWKAAGEPDPHDARYYDRERATLCMGNLTDDELANGAFMNYDRIPSVAELVAGKPTPMVWMTAVKDRIRWLSRALEKALATQAQPATHAEVLSDQAIDVIAYKLLNEGAAFPCIFNAVPAGKELFPFSRALVRAALATQAAQQPKDLGDASGPGSTSLRSSDPYRDLPTSER